MSADIIAAVTHLIPPARQIPGAASEFPILGPNRRSVQTPALRRFEASGASGPALAHVLRLDYGPTMLRLQRLDLRVDDPDREWRTGAVRMVPRAGVPD